MGYWFTIIGALFKGICDWLLAAGVTGESAEFAQTIFTWFGFILSSIGVVKSLLLGEGLKGKLIAVAIHALIWVIVLFGLGIVLPIIILGVVVFVVDGMFLGGSIMGFIHDRFAGLGGDGEMDWPITIYDGIGGAYRLSDNWGSYVRYTNVDTGETIDVSLDDVEDNRINTIYGSFTW